MLTSPRLHYHDLRLFHSSSSLLVDVANPDLGLAHVGNYYRLQTALMQDALPGGPGGKDGRKKDGPSAAGLPGGIPGCWGLQVRSRSPAWHSLALMRMDSCWTLHGACMGLLCAR